MTADLAAVVLTRNEERHVGECLDSLAWADTRVVWDSFSTDQTLPVALAHGAQVFQHPFESYAAQRNAALDAVDARWVLFVDADERATAELAGEVRDAIREGGDSDLAGWWIPRHNYMIGHRMRGGGWYPDHQLRLLRRGWARYDVARPVHEVVVLEGRAGTLDSVLIHYNYDTVAQFRAKMQRYTAFEAEILWRQGVRVRPWTLASMPVREFWRRFVRLGGYKDHVYGLLFCGLMARYTLETYSRLRRLPRTA